jgi:hypothetical protein
MKAECPLDITKIFKLEIDRSIVEILQNCTLVELFLAKLACKGGELKSSYTKPIEMFYYLSL